MRRARRGRKRRTILEIRGSSPRNYKNTLVFLAADTNRLRELEQAVRQYLAWSSIWDDRVTLNLDQFQSQQAETKRKNADETVDARIPETYQWLIVPGQPDPQGQHRVDRDPPPGPGALATRASKKLKSEELFMVQLGGVGSATRSTAFRSGGGITSGSSNSARTWPAIFTCPESATRISVIAAVQRWAGANSWQEDTFAYAEGWDEARGRYKGLRGGQPAGRVSADSDALIVKPDIAAAQIEADRRGRKASTPGVHGTPTPLSNQTWTRPA